jgi:hypothetical protein
VGTNNLKNFPRQARQAIRLATRACNSQGMTSHARQLDATYQAARTRFIDAATRSGADLSSFPHPLTGLEGEELAIDVAQLGDPQAPNVLLLISATHGVEGYAGSALQSWWLEERAAQLGSGIRVVIVHGFNPVGFSWVRRVNEDNVDLNRNFVDWTAPPTNAAYSEIADLLVPLSWTEETQATSTGALLEFAGKIGLEQFQQVVSGGQYDHPTGIFHGGSGPVWSHRWLVEQLADLVAPSTRVGVIDLHTGLGDWGHGELISHEAVGSPGYDRSAEWWGDVRSMQSGESVSAALSGDWLGAIDALLPHVEITCAALEYGTVDVISVLQALRADAWLNAHGDPTGNQAPAIREQVRAAFADDDPAWLAKITERFAEVSDAALTALAR